MSELLIMPGFLIIEENTRMIDLRISIIELYNLIFLIGKNITFSYLPVVF